MKAEAKARRARIRGRVDPRAGGLVVIRLDLVGDPIGGGAGAGRRLAGSVPQDEDRRDWGELGGVEPREPRGRRGFHRREAGR